jgi:hypothetical protein
MELGDKDLTVSLFEHFPIRRTWHMDEWWYSCVDCMAALTATPNATRYWSDFKRDLLRKEGIDMYALGVSQLPMPNNVGKVRKTDCATMQIMLRLLQSVKSPRAEPFKMWLAELGAVAIQDEEEKALRAAYRLQLHHFDAMLHELVTFRGIVTPAQHAALDEANYQGLYEMNNRMALVVHRHLPMSALPSGVGPEGFMGPEELGVHIFQRTQAAARIKDHNSQGEQVYIDAQDVGTEIRRTLARLGRPMPEDMPRYPMLRNTEWLPESEQHFLSQMQWDEATEEPGEAYSVIQIMALPEGDQTNADSDETGADE